MDKTLIPPKLYKKIVELVPILCVDVILKYKGKFVLLKRANEPIKNTWWVPGGRAFKGEKTLDTAKRKVFQETGLKAVKYDFFGVYEDSYKKSAWGVPASSVSVVYTAEVEVFRPKLDETSTDIKLSDRLPTRFLDKLL